MEAKKNRAKDSLINFGPYGKVSRRMVLKWVREYSTPVEIWGLRGLAHFAAEYLEPEQIFERTELMRWAIINIRRRKRAKRESVNR